MYRKWKHTEHNMLRYDECKNNINKDFRSYPEMTVQVVLMKFYGGIYVFDSLTLRINVRRFIQVSINNSHNNFVLNSRVYFVETVTDLSQNLYRINWM